MYVTIRIPHFLAILIFQCFLFSNVAFALDPGVPISHYREYQLEEHLTRAIHSVFSINQTHDGYLWIGTQNGLFRFDGERYTRYTSFSCPGLKGNRIAVLHLDRQGVLWLGTMAGLTSYYRGHFETITTENGLSSNDVIALQQDSFGRLWIGLFDNYLNYQNHGKIIRIGPENGLHGIRIHTILEDKNNVIWIGTDKHGLYQFDDNKVKKTVNPTLPKQFSVYKLSLDRKGNIWIASDQGLFGLSDGTIDHYSVKDGLTTNMVKDVLVDSDDNIWCGTENGLVRLIIDVNGKPVEVSSLWPNIAINCLFEDSENNLWIGTKQGLKCLQNILFRSQSGPDRTSINAVSLYEDRSGIIWIGSSFGLYISQQHHIQKFDIDPVHLTNTIEPAWIRAINEDDRGNIWISTQGSGLLCIGEHSIKNYTTSDNLTSNLIKALYFDSNERLWIGTDAGLNYFSDNIFSHVQSKYNWLDESIYFIFEDSFRNTWFGTPHGIIMSDKGNLSDDSLRNYNLHCPCLSMYEDEQHNLWICTYGFGLCMNKNGDFHFFNSESGLTSNFVSSLLEDEQGYFWLTSDVGVLHVSKQELLDFSLGKTLSIACSSFTEKHGLPSSKCSLLGGQTTLKRSDGEFWFATEKGIAMISPEDMYEKFFALPNIILEKILANDHEVYPPFKNVAFQSDSDLSIYFSAPRFKFREQLRFRYKLSSFDHDWVTLEPNEKTIVQYTNLPSGLYTFDVEVYDYSRIWETKSSRIVFTIKPSIAKRIFLPFSVILLIILSIILVTIIKQRNKKLREFLQIEGQTDNCVVKDKSHDDVKTEKQLQSLLFALHHDKKYRDETLSLQSFAHYLDIPAHQLSKVINEKCGKSFFDLINYYRINEAKEILAEPGNNEKLIVTIAYSVGFSSKAAFYRAFKKFTDMTPSEYKKKYQNPNASDCSSFYE